MKTVNAYVCDILMTEGVYCNSTADLEQEVGKILREVWQSATMAQMEKDAKDEGVVAECSFSPVNFPGDPT